MAPFLAECGLTLIDLRKNKHWRAVVERPDGSQTAVSLPTSLDDCALLNKRSQLRNIARG